METVNCLRCDFRHKDNGNCTAVGGFCTAVPAAHCPMLQKYLDTGLTPELVQETAELAIWIHENGLEKIQEWIKADRDGRLVVLSSNKALTNADRMRTATNQQLAKLLYDNQKELCRLIYKTLGFENELKFSEDYSDILAWLNTSEKRRRKPWRRQRMIELIPCPFAAVKQNGMKRTKHLNVRSVERQYHLLGVYFENILIRIIDTANIWLGFGIGGKLAMADYIERKVVKELLNINYGGYLDAVDRIPAADVVPVVHGRWAHLGGDEWCCSACGFVLTTEGSWDKPTKKYCEDCGAKMDGGAK